MPTNTTFNVTTIGNALVDILAQTDDAFLTSHNMAKGTMQLVDEKTADRLYHSLKGSKVERSGGSAGNTAAGIASFGGKTAFIGKVQNDTLGAVYKQDMANTGVHFSTPFANHDGATGHCVVAITPDAQRTMSTFLGVAPHITPTDIDEGLIANSQVTYLEGYLWDQEEAKEAIRKAMSVAKAHGNDIAFTLSDPFCVGRHRTQFLELIQDYITILFANEHEITSLFKVEDIHEAASLIRQHCKVALLTRSDKGSLIVTPDTIHEIKAQQGLKVVDTTGAGDLYASGFLYGYTHGYDLPICGRLATLAASEVIQHIGARPETSLKDLLKTV